MADRNPLWGEEVHRLDDFLHLTSLDPCPIPVAGKLATTVTFTVSEDHPERRCSPHSTLTFGRVGDDLGGDLISKPGWSIEVMQSIEDSAVRVSCPVLEQFVRAGGVIGAATRARGWSLGKIHLSGSACWEDVNSLCGASAGYSDWMSSTPRNGLSRNVRAAGEEHDPYVYKVCSTCRRIAEARMKRKCRKPDPEIKAAKLRAEVERVQAEREKRWEAEDAKRKAERDARNEQRINGLMAVIEPHLRQPPASGTREDLRADLMRWYTGPPVGPSKEVSDEQSA
jgi:hypothetical protein